MLPSAQTAVYDALLLDGFDDDDDGASALAASAVRDGALADFQAADLEALAALFPPDAAEPPTPTSKPKKGGPGGNNARKRQREEIHALREAAAALETQLAALQGRTLPPANRAARHRAGDKRERQITELDNVHLSKLVSDHLKVAQSFEKALRKHRPLSAADILAGKPPSSASQNPPQVKEASLKSVVLTPEDGAMFEVLAESVETRYHEVEKVFRAVGLDECRTNLREATLDASGEGGVRLKFKSSRLIPFSVQVINETAVRIGKSQHTNGPGHVVERVGAKLSFKKQFQVGAAHVKACGVSKRYMESDRIVLIWEGVSEWASEPGGELVTIEEKGWCVIQPYSQSSSKPSSSSHEKNPLSMMQSYIYLKPSRGTSGSAKWEAPQPKHVAILSEVVMPSYEEMFRARMQHLENMLVEESLLQRRLVA